MMKIECESCGNLKECKWYEIADSLTDSHIDSSYYCKECVNSINEENDGLKCI